MEDDLDYDLPFFDFTSDETPANAGDWFFRGAQEGEMEEDSRAFCPSPSKKQRVTEDSEPRRSPRLHANAKYKSTEQMELEKIEAMRKRFAKAKKNHEIVYKKAIAQGKPVPLKSTQPPTIPQGFHFQSDQRIKGTAELVEDTSVKDFAKMLRSSGPSNAVKLQAPKSTKPQPFNLTKSVSNVQVSGKYMSTAEQLVAYNRSGLRSGSGGASSSRRAVSPTLTIAKTPKLSTKGRSRTLKVPTREEEEEAEFEKHKQQQFKAHGVNQKIFSEPQLGVRKVKPPTAVREFQLHTHHSKAFKHLATEEKTPGFHAHPINQKILDGPTGVRPADKRPLTVAQSPAFSLKNRLRSREKLHPSQAVSPPMPKKTFSKPVPHMGVPFRPQLEHKYTVTKPFAVDEHSKEMLRRKELRIQQVFEEEKKAREFHAGLLPSDSPDQLPAKKTRPVTAAEPFSLAVDERGNKYQEEWKSKQIEEQEGQARAKTRFHATSNKVVFKAPFIPEKSSRPLTEMSSFTLNTDQRAHKREYFNQQLKAHEAEVEALKRQREDRKLEDEKNVVSQLRQEMVPKATTIKKYKQVNPVPSDKPLTVAQSPCLQTNRLRSTRHSATSDE